MGLLSEEYTNNHWILLNKVFHYDAIMFAKEERFKCTKIHNLIYKLIRDMNGKSTLKKIKSIDSFDSVYLKGIEKKFLK